MSDRKTETVKSRRTFDSAYGFSFSIAVGLVLFIAGLIISLTVGGAGGIGLIFGIPLLTAGLILPLVMTGQRVTSDDIVELGYGGLLEREMAFRFPPYDAETSHEEDSDNDES